jgi:quinoprotein glucose dehydrogenase
MPRFCVAIVSALVLAVQPPPPLWAVPGDVPPPPEQPQIAAASNDGEQALAGFRLPAGLKGELWAAEPLLANPVAFCLDHRGRIYVCETFRQSRGVEDNRGHEHWLDDDLAAMTIEDRLAYIRKHLGDKAGDYTKHDDRVRLLEDTDGDGRADKHSIFADRFNGILDGTAAGLLAREGNVYLTCIPHLWLLRDENGDGQAEMRRALSTGYGVRFAFRGHDLHGLALGPGGRLYFSVGDRGLNVKTNEGQQLVNPESGAVLRCELDGSNLEIFATGLRNPQELAFDDFGNLFTGDNNSDSGDQARWVHVVEGGDSGWRMAYQYLPDRGPFNREKIWHPQNVDQPACIVPPICNFASGPSGLAYFPGTGLTDHFKDRFLLVDFRGGPANSGVRSFRLKPKGASFEMVDAEETLWNVLATDVDFGPDGALYLTDWVDGWNGEGKGRIYRFHSPDAANSEIVKQVQKLLAEGFAQRPVDELVGLLSHADRRVRQEAQFALVKQRAAQPLSDVAAKSPHQLARIHAIWGLGQLEKQPECRVWVDDTLYLLLKDADAEIRAQSLREIGDRKLEHLASEAAALLGDDSPRVRYFAAQALGKIGGEDQIDALLNLLDENADADPMLRHAAVMGLAGSSRGSTKALMDHAHHPSPAARMGLLLALRRLLSEQVAVFLNDADPRLVVEAARAIHDAPIPAAMPQLAALASREMRDDALIRRVLNANYRLGSPENAAAVADYAARAGAPEAMRLEALDMLANWAKPSNRDRVLGMWRSLAERSAADAAGALRTNLAGIFSGPDRVRAAAAQVAAMLDIKEVIPELCTLLADKSQPPQTRADALTALVAVKFAEIEPTARQSLADESPAVRAAARAVLADLKVADAVSLLDQALAGEKVERQAALAALGKLRGSEVNEVLAKALDRLLAGDFPADSELDLVTATESRLRGSVKSKFAEYESRLKADDALAAWRACLEGGDAERGRKLFFERGQLSCVRCHKIGTTGGDVGPELTKIAGDKEKHREYLLESIVAPSKTIAKNFETVVIQDTDGRQHTGILKQEDTEKLTLMTAEGRLVTIPLAEIDARKAGKSSMPEDLTKHVTRHELRDLVEFLSTLK